MKFPKEDLQEALWGDNPNYEIVVNEIADTSRWSVHYDLVFKHGDRFYATSYSTGATEYQDESPFEYDGDEIECVEVTPMEKTITTYVPIN